MGTAEFIKKAWTGLIVRTENPIMPLLVQKAHGGASSLGMQLAQVKGTNKEAVDAIQETLTTAYSEEHINELSKTPEFVIALCAMLCSAIEQYTVDTTRNYR